MYELKATVDRALTSLRLRSKSKLGSRCNSSKSLDFLSETPTPSTQPYFGLQRSVSSGEYSLGDEEESPPFPAKKAKPPFIVLVSTLAGDEGEVPWNAECDFRLEEVYIHTLTCMDSHWRAEEVYTYTHLYGLPLAAEEVYIHTLTCMDSHWQDGLDCARVLAGATRASSEWPLFYSTC